VRAGAFKDYTVPVLEEVFGTAGRLRELTVSGMTDLQIVAEALSCEGFTHAEIRARLRDLSRVYLAALERVTSLHASEPVFEVLPGVREILEAADAHPRYRSALLTGNIRPAAYLKMQLVGLDRYFTLPGAFGDDSHERRELPAIAQRRINKHLGFSSNQLNSSSSATRLMTSPARDTSARAPSASARAASTTSRPCARTIQTRSSTIFQTHRRSCGCLTRCESDSSRRQAAEDL
jgi:hypothetical protein